MKKFSHVERLFVVSVKYPDGSFGVSSEGYQNLQDAIDFCSLRSGDPKGTVNGLTFHAPDGHVYMIKGMTYKVFK